MSTKKLRLGVIGAGWFVSRRHLPDAMNNPSIEVVGLTRRDAEKRTNLLNHFKLPLDCGYQEWEQMLEEAKPDGVLIATPNNLHYEQAKAALERGIHVLLEKPMTIRSEDAHELNDIAEAKGLKIGVALNPPFWGHCHRAKRAVTSGKIGEIESATLYWTGCAEHLFGRGAMPSDLPGVVGPSLYRSDPEQNGGGYFIDGGSHLVSELIWITGLRVKRVAALMDDTPLDMRISVSLEMENGALASINSIGNSKLNTRRVRNVFGASLGTIVIAHNDFETQILIPGQESIKFKESDILPVANPVSNFADAILTGSELFSPGTHGAHVVEVVEACYRSAETGQAVTILEREKR